MTKLSPIREAILVQKAQRGDKKSMEELLKAYEHMIESIVLRFSIPTFEVDDTRQAAKFGFIIAVKNFKTDRNAKFITAAYWGVEGHLKKELRSVVGRSKTGGFASPDSISYKISNPLYSLSETSTGNPNLILESLQSLDVRDEIHVGLLLDDIYLALPDEQHQEVLSMMLEGYNVSEIVVKTKLTNFIVKAIIHNIQAVSARLIANLDDDE